MIKLICKNFILQLSLNNNICLDNCLIITKFINFNYNNYIIDIFNYINNKNNLPFFRENKNPYAIYIPYTPFNFDEHFFKIIINTFFTYFKKDILSIFNNNHYFPILKKTILNNITTINYTLKNNNIFINSDITITNDNNYLSLHVKWKTTQLIYKILSKKKYDYIINHFYYMNDNNELQNITFTTKKFNKISKMNIKILKHQIITIFYIFFDFFFKKLHYKYILVNNNENYYEIFGLNKTSFNFSINIKITNNNLNDNNIIDSINKFIYELFIHNINNII
jgi:hypothetical protein